MGGELNMDIDTLSERSEEEKSKDQGGGQEPDEGALRPRRRRRLHSLQAFPGEDVRCLEVNASHFLSLASTKSLHRRTSTFFGATDEPSRTIQEIAGFIEIHSRDRGR